MGKNVIQVLILSITLAGLIACSEKKDAGFDLKVKLDEKKCYSDYELSGVVGGTRIGTEDPLSKKVVMLLMSDGNKMLICTGTPISKDVILTAAHCTKDFSPGQVVALFHPDALCSSGFDSTSKSIGARDIIIHQGYSKDVRAIDDVSLIRLRSAIPSDYEVSELYDGEEAGDKVTMIGYGITSDGRGDSAKLRKVFKSKKQTSVYGHILTVLQSDEKGICQGDSGGPVFFDVNGRTKVAGVNSVVYGPEGKACRTSSMAMYVPYFKDWIQTKKAALR